MAEIVVFGGTFYALRYWQDKCGGLPTPPAPPVPVDTSEDWLPAPSRRGKRRGRKSGGSSGALRPAPPATVAAPADGDGDGEECTAANVQAAIDRLRFSQGAAADDDSSDDEAKEASPRRTLRGMMGFPSLADAASVTPQKRRPATPVVAVEDSSSSDEPEPPPPPRVRGWVAAEISPDGGDDGGWEVIDAAPPRAARPPKPKVSSPSVVSLSAPTASAAGGLRDDFPGAAKVKTAPISQTEKNRRKAQKKKEKALLIREMQREA